MTTIAANWADLIDPLVRFRTDQAFTRRPSLLPLLYNVQGSNTDMESVTGVGAIGIDAWANYENAGQIPEVNFDQGYKQTYTHREFIVDFSIERKLIDDNKHGEVLRISDRIGDSAALKREVDRASVWNNAFTDTAPYAGSDAVGLCSTAHPLSPEKTGVTQSNEFTYALTKDNVAAIREAMMAFTDDNGNILAVQPRRLHVPPELEDEALVIANSLLDPTSGNNAINPQSGRWEVLVDHYLTDANAWFLEDPTLQMMYVDWFNRVPFSVYLRDGDDRTVKSYWRSYMRYSFGFSGWQWIAGSNPS